MLLAAAAFLGLLAQTIITGSTYEQKPTRNKVETQENREAIPLTTEADQGQYR